MKINHYQSNKLRILSLLLMVLVVLIHSEYLEARQYPVSRWITLFTGARGLSQVAVPMFFMISGMLFFNNADSISSVFAKMRKRCLTLLLPYIIWNITFVLIYLVVQSIPACEQFNNSDIVGNIFGGTIWHGLYEVFIIPINFPLWFLRDLLLYVALAPILYFALRALRVWSLIPIVAIGLTLNIFNGLIFFAIGGYIAMYVGLERIDNFKWTFWPSAIIFVASAFAVSSGVYFWIGISDFVSVCGILTVWLGYDYVAHRQTQPPGWLLDFAKYSFFIYLSHEPTFNIVKKLMLRAFGQSEASIISLYFVNVVLMCLICIYTAKLLKHIAPRFYNVLVGFRA